ncbi:MAG: hypothetical protein KatS3mg110_4151 [Pirellulaceae bacterium]|nr:MAG: hypothetical protein KatS3mg110_4151 [Pirellulaceae bacterium]
MTHDTRRATDRRFSQIGFSQRVRLEWLQRTANLVLAGNDEASIYNALQELLEDKLSVDRGVRASSVKPQASEGPEPRSTHDARRATQRRIRGNREKVITILMKIWVRPPRELRPLQHDGLELLLYLPREYHIAVHWGMTMAVYPFWWSVAAHVGRLLRLQGAVTPKQVHRRLMEQYGERPTVKDAVRRVLRAMVDWGVLDDGKAGDAPVPKGTYFAGLSLAIDNAKLAAWLAEAHLRAHSTGSLRLSALLNAPSLFPFRLSHIPPAQLIAASGRLDVLPDGLGQDLIMLRAESPPAATRGES